MSQYQQRQRARSGNGNNAPKESKADPPEQVTSIAKCRPATPLRCCCISNDEPFICICSTPLYVVRYRLDPEHVKTIGR